MNSPTDRYGVPANLLGSIPEEYFALLGRIVAVAGVVEIQIAHLHAALSDEPQARSFGLSSGRALQELRALLKGDSPIPARPTLDVATRKGLRQLEERLRKAMYRRNEYLHGPWTESFDGRVFTWRPLPADQSQEQDSPGVNATQGAYVDEQDLRSFLTTLVSLFATVQRELPMLEQFRRWP